jgi:diadenosine tetraphosphate (Ap4A) HIT family hydrolase
LQATAVVAREWHTFRLVFLDIGPVSQGHALLIPKCEHHAAVVFGYTTGVESSSLKDHSEKMHEVPDEYLQEILPLAKKVAIAIGAENYNILQVNRRQFNLVNGQFLTSPKLALRITEE